MVGITDMQIYDLDPIPFVRIVSDWKSCLGVGSDRITIEIIKNHFSLFSIINDKTAYDKTSLDKLA